VTTHLNTWLLDLSNWLQMISVNDALVSWQTMRKPFSQSDKIDQLQFVIDSSLFMNLTQTVNILKSFCSLPCCCCPIYAVVSTGFNLVWETAFMCLASNSKIGFYPAKTSFTIIVGNIF